MKTKLFLSVVILLVGVSFGFAQAMTKNSGKASRPNPAEQTLMNNENFIWNSLKNKKYDDFGKFFADSYQGRYANGALTRDGEIAEAKTFEVKNYTLSDMKIVFPNSNTAILTYKVTLDAVAGGQSFTETDLASSVWVKSGGKWMAYLHQHTPIK